MLFNANLDRAQRRPLGELRVELRRWEDERRAKRGAVADVAAHQVRLLPLAVPA